MSLSKIPHHPVISVKDHTSSVVTSEKADLPGVSVKKTKYSFDLNKEDDFYEKKEVKKDMIMDVDSCNKQTLDADLYAKVCGWTHEHEKVLNVLVKVYPNWSEILKSAREPHQLVDLLVLLSYVDCSWPNLFKVPRDISENVKMESSKLDLYGSYGDVPMLLYIYYSWKNLRKRERPGWCDRHFIDDVPLKRLDKTMSNFKDLIKKELDIQMSWLHDTMLMGCPCIQDKVMSWSKLLLQTNPDLLYMHTGLPGLKYVNVKYGSTKPHCLTPESSLGLLSSPPKYVFCLPSNVSDKRFKEMKNDNIFSINCDEFLPKDIYDEGQFATSVLSRLKPQLIKSTNQNTVQKYVIKDVGDAVLRTLSGDDANRLNVLRDEIASHLCNGQKDCIDNNHPIRAECRDSWFHLDIDLYNNQVILYALPADMDKAKDVLNYNIEVMKSETNSKVYKLQIPEQKSGSILMGPGGLLQSFDYQEEAKFSALLFVNSVQKHREVFYELATQEYIKNTLLPCLASGSVVEVKQSKNFPATTLWGTITFQNAYWRKWAVDLFNRDGGKFRLEPIKEAAYEVVTKFSVKREMHRNVKVRFWNQDTFNAVRKFPWEEYWVCETKFYPSTNQGKFTFKLPRHDLFKMQREIEDIANSQTNLNHYHRGTTLSYEEMPPKDWSKETLQKVLDNTIVDEPKKLKQLVKDSMKVSYRDVLDTDTVLHGEVSRISYVPKKQLLNNMDAFVNPVKINIEGQEKEFKVTQDGHYDRFTTVLTKETFKVIEEPLNKKKFTTDWFEEYCTWHKGENGSSRVQLEWRDWECLSDAVRAEIEKVVDLLKPKIIHGLDSSIVRWHEAGYSPFLHLMKEQHVSIEVDPEMRLLRIFGTPRHRKKATKKILAILTHRATEAEKDRNHYRFEEVPLYGNGIPNDLVTELYKRYGSPWFKLLKDKTECQLIYFSKATKNLECKGSRQAIEKVKVCLDEVYFELTGNAQKFYTKQQECVACFCPICPIENPKVSLEICGHVYCTDCLTTQVKTNIGDRHLPVKCARENCGMPMSVADILSACTKGGLQLDDLVNLSLQRHLMAYKSEILPCITPDCPFIYRAAVSPSDTEAGPSTSAATADNIENQTNADAISSSTVFHCPGCKVSICTRCKTLAHPGLSCKIKKIIDTLEDPLLKAWIDENPTNRKMCPECRMGIEKVDGCDNVYCTGCETSICWRCQATFKKSQDCYTHLNKHTNGENEPNNGNPVLL